MTASCRMQTASPLVNLIAPVRLRLAVDILAATLRPAINAIHGVDPLGLGRCIMVSLAARDLLRAVGYAQARAAPCSVVAENAAAQVWARRAADCSDIERARLAREYRDAHGAHTVWIGQSDDPAGQIGWPGHLVTLVDGYLVDLTLDQAARPHKHLPLVPMAVPLAAPREVIRAQSGDLLARMREEVCGAMVSWYAAPENTGYLGTRAALSSRRRPVVESLVAVLRAALARVEA